MGKSNQKSNAFGVDVDYQIHSEKYVDFCIMHTLNAPFAVLMNPSGANIRNGYLGFTIGVDLLESLCVARKYIGEAYFEEVKKIRAEKKATLDDAVFDYVVARKRFELLLRTIVEAAPQERELATGVPDDEDLRFKKRVKGGASGVAPPEATLLDE